METPKGKSEQAKRKHDELSSVSSVSDLDISKDSPCVLSERDTENCEQQTKTSRKQKKKSAKLELLDAELSLDLCSSLEIENPAEREKTKMNPVETQLAEINKKLSDVFTKSDSKMLKDIIKETIYELKESLLAPLIKRVDIVESDLHDKAIENETLKKQVAELSKKLEDQKDESEALKSKIQGEKLSSVEQLNDLEQYTRKNSMRISSLPGDKETESAVETMEKVITFISTKLSVVINQKDIDIAHRLGKFKINENRAVIVKFVNRYEKSNIMARKKNLKGSGYMIFEDLTKLNNEVLASVRLKQKDKVDQSWSTNGKLFVKWKSGQIEKVPFGQYKYWLDLPWP